MHGCVEHMEVHLWGGCVLLPIALRNKQQKCVYILWIPLVKGDFNLHISFD